LRQQRGKPRTAFPPAVSVLPHRQNPHIVVSAAVEHPNSNKSTLSFPLTPDVQHDLDGRGQLAVQGRP
jgi:hypothetical protein